MKLSVGKVFIPSELSVALQTGIAYANLVTVTETFIEAGYQRIVLAHIQGAESWQFRTRGFNPAPDDT